MFEAMNFYSSDNSVKMEDFSHHIAYQSNEFCLIYIDMMYNRFIPDSLSSGGGKIGVGLEVPKSDSNEYEMVLLEFDCPNDDWDIFCAQTMKHTVSLAIVKKSSTDNVERETKTVARAA